jgi:5-methylcytosine-specific restriction enzyme subunit McrC
VTPLIELKEGGDWVYHPTLTDIQADAVRAFGHVDIKRESGSWRVKAKSGPHGWAGFVRIGTGVDAVEIRVEPKVPIQRLLYLVGYTRYKAIKDLAWREEEIDVGAADELVPAVAHAFARSASRALARGLPHGYRETEAVSMDIRGRIRTSDQVREHWSLPFPAEIRYDEYVPDILENQLLRAATERLLAPGLIPEDRLRLDKFSPTLTALRDLRRRLAGVSPLVPGRRPNWNAVPRDRGWRAALSLADLVLRDQSYELRSGTAGAADGLFLRMWQLFEDFVTIALALRLEDDGGGRCTPQDNRHRLVDNWDGGGTRFNLTPDLVYYRPGPGGPPVPFAVIDAKYKTSGKATREDIHEVLAYCTVFGVKYGYVVLPGDPADSHTHRITGSRITITEHFFDLDQPPDHLRRQVRELGGDILRLG